MINNEYPIVLGLAGGMASGKTSAAEMLAPRGQYGPVEFGVSWMHLFYALPLYRIATIRQKTQGVDAFDRQCYALHEALHDIFKGNIFYDDLVDIVYEVAHLDIPLEGKPRKFLQYVGTDICRQFDPDCFIKWMDRKIKEEFHLWNTRINENEKVKLGIVVSDARFLNECKLIKDQPNGVLIKLEVRSEVAEQRLLARDKDFDPSSKSHLSENSLIDVPAKWFDAVLDTSYISEDQKIQYIREVVHAKTTN